MTRRAVAAFALLAVATPGVAAAWGPIGHRVVGRIAAAHLSPAAAAEVEALLGPETLSEAATWADFVRGDTAWKHADPWHYVNVPDGVAYEASAKDPRGDILVSIAGFSTVLADREAPRGRRIEALRFLAHLVGDLHQPLHVGRREDRGGNEVELTFEGRPTDLHTLWDHDLIDAQRLSYSEYAEILDRPSPADVAAWQASEVRAWAQESQDLRAQLYEIGDGELDEVYVFRQLPTLERRLLQAGIRLAGLLDRLLVPQSPAPGAR